MSTYTCPHCGERGLSTQKRHWCPKAPKISEVLRLGPPRSMDPIANEYIDRLTRELEEARETIRDLVDDEYAGLVWVGKRMVCAYCDADSLYSVAHADDCPIVRARRALAKDTEVSDGE